MYILTSSCLTVKLGYSLRNFHNMALTIKSMLILFVMFMDTTKVSARKLNGINLAVGKTAIQSSDYLVYTAEKAVDGNTAGNFHDESCTHTTNYINEFPEWWEVDLGDVYDIVDIVIYNRLDCCGDRLHNFVIEGGQDCVNSSLTCYTPCYTQLDRIGVSTRISCSFCRARYLRIKLNQTGILSLCEVEVYGQLGTSTLAGPQMCSEYSNETSSILESSIFSSYLESSFMESTWVIPETTAYTTWSTTDIPTYTTWSTTDIPTYTTWSPTDKTTNASVETVTNEYCSCTCRKIEDDPKAIEAKLTQIKENLTVSVVKLSSSRRKKTSATDERPSATSVGYLGVVILSVVMGIFVIQDILTALIFIFSQIQLAIRNKKSIKPNNKMVDSKKDELRLPRDRTIILKKGERIGNTVIISDL